MQQIITAKLKLCTTPEQLRALRQTKLAYRDALNAVSRNAFAHGKMSNQQTLQRAGNDDLPQAQRLPAPMACNVSRQVAATYKTRWTKGRLLRGRLRAPRSATRDGEAYCTSQACPMRVYHARESARQW